MLSQDSFKHKEATDTLKEMRSYLQTHIPTLNDIAKKELYDIVHTYHIPFTKNQNGVFMNLAYLEEKHIHTLYTHCVYFVNSIKLTEKTEQELQGKNVMVIDQTLMQECVRDVIKDSLSDSLQEKLNKKLSIFAKESNWKYQPIPNTHTKNAELGKVRGRISRKKNHLLKRCRDISLYLSNKDKTKEQDILSATNELSVEQG